MKTPKIPSPATIALALGVVLAPTLLPATGTAADWPRYRGASHDGVISETVQPWREPGPKVVWKTPTPGGFSSFVTGDGKAFTLVKRKGSDVEEETCVALDLQSGKEVWAAPVGIAKYQGGGDAGTPTNQGGDGPRSTPAVDGDRVYVTSADLVVFCLSARDGKTIWKRDLIKENAGVNISWKNAASPVVEGGLILVAGGGPGQALLGLDKSTGEPKWKAEDDKMTHATPVVTELAGVRQAIFFTQKGLVAVEPATGKTLWRYGFRYNVSTAASPVISGDIVYCSAGYGVGAAAVRVSREGDAWKATELWRKPNELMNHWSTPLVSNGHLYGIFGFKEYGKAPLKCVELATGKELWSKDGFGPGNVLISGKNLLVLSDAGELVMVEASTAAYKELGRTQAVGGKCWSTPSVSNGRILVRSTTEAVCLDPRTRLTSN